MITSLSLALFPDSDSEVNVWLKENPVIAGLIFLVIGAVLFYTGLRQLRSGVATDKYGIEYNGKMGRVISLIRVVIGVAAVGFGVYTMIYGLP